MRREDQGLEVSRHRYQVVPRTLCFVRHGDEVLLLKGALSKLLWAGLYNGLGGHVEAGEDLLSAILREVREEAELEVHSVRLAAVVHADAGDAQLGILFFVFTAWADTRDVIESPEGALEWVPISALPMEDMVPDLPIILPRVLALPPSAPPLFLAYSHDEQNQLVIRFAEPV